MNELSHRVPFPVPPAATTAWPPGWEATAHSVGTARYTDPAFARLEHDRLWSRVRAPASGPDQWTFEILSTRTLPAATRPARAVVQRVTDLTDPEQVRLIPRQDIGNIPSIQKGLHSRSIRRV
jgi:hypothetical protein